MPTIHLEQKFYDKPLGLLGVARWEVPADRLTKQLEAETSVQVPGTTQFIHLAVTTAEFDRGTRLDNVADKVAVVWFAATRDLDDTGKLIIKDGETKIFFEAVLQSTDEKSPTGRWSGRFVIEIMCFGYPTA